MERVFFPAFLKSLLVLFIFYIKNYASDVHAVKKKKSLFLYSTEYSTVQNTEYSTVQNTIQYRRGNTPVPPSSPPTSPCLSGFLCSFPKKPSPPPPSMHACACAHMRAHTHTQTHRHTQIGFYVFFWSWFFFV